MKSNLFLLNYCFMKRMLFTNRLTYFPLETDVKGREIAFASLGSLAPKARATYRVTCRATTPGDMRFHVEMTSDQITSPVEEDEATRIYSREK